MYLIVRSCFCDARLLCWNKMWFCILETINSTMGRLFLVLIVEGICHPMRAWAGTVERGRYSAHPFATPRYKMGRQYHVPVALLSGKSPVILYKWLNGPRVRSGGFDPRTVHPVVSRYIHHASTDFTYQNWSCASKRETRSLVVIYYEK